ncbi:hypothetical protein [Sphingomonas sp. SUN039]|uniref:hypothetical protein n=1 Tax=Sphingomonas sp. SUN039 TaxID=2937787 RepID=UPI002164C131|nr:hypothetical protein [Sphingomonas sp. SUN039]UVO54004.1 hypothetical protein M0209_07670 [Sphingomonas sp. SUN039]
MQSTKVQGGFREKFGHLVPRTIEALPRRSLFQIQGIWLKLVPFLAGRHENETSPLAVALRDAILSEWASRSRLALLDPDRFPWPSTEVTDGGGGNGVAGELEPLGMLAFLGYHVGIAQGLSPQNRRAILDTAYAESLPPLIGPAYMRGWGDPESGTRLRKLAESLAAFARSAKRRRTDTLQQAISDWEADLRYLKVTYYDGRYGFGWPTQLPLPR